MSDPKSDRNIIMLGFVSLLNDISSEIIQPVLPLFISSLGGGGLAVGLIGGISEGLPSILKIFAGWWSDRLGKRKPLVVAGYALSAAGKLLLPVASAWQHVFFFKVLERSGKGIRSAPRDAMISESASSERRGRGFGLHRAMDSAGAVVGSIMAYLLWQGGLSYSSIFLTAGVMAVLALLPFSRVEERFSAPACGASLKLSGLSSELKAFIAVASLFALGNFSYMFFILRAQELFSGAEAVAAPLLLYVLFNLVYSIMSMPVGIWSDRVGRRLVLVLGYGLFAATALGFAFVSSLAGLIVLFSLYGLVYAMVDGSEKAYVSDLSSASLRGSCLGIYYGAVGVVAIASSLIAGAIWSSWGAEATFLFGAVAAALAAVGLLSVGAEKINAGKLS
ncbi:MAG TPA: MFS transporter [Methanothrix sp.]|jgi:MFS family permease|nr:MFS transporter [Methanothrix sp.]HOV82258.1 MFS transporter [Methanothrix sp.]HPC90148.1 MFS transporter [Methanothrix sp.]HQE86899.1 MFS transporter [Methanothrix sp.]HQI67858.1 MFS transporter [Methanothrix sp.]